MIAFYSTRIVVIGSTRAARRAGSAHAASAAATMVAGGAAKVSGSCVVMPKTVKPEYAVEAMRNLVQGAVWLEAVVLADGSVGAPRLTRSLDLDLDQAAVAAMRRWRFQPGTRDGKPVPVLVEVEMSFRLK